MATIEGVGGKQFLPSSPEYDGWSYQYATSSLAAEHNMNPGLIVQPINKQDIKLVVKYAKKNKKAIAIRTGGHQYSGASSTGKENILLDLRTTFKAPDDLTIVEKGSKSYARVSVSHNLGQLNVFLGEHKVWSVSSLKCHH
jgi:transketolase C-terminal domain/subunit